MTDLTGKQIANTYKQLLKVAVSTNDGIDATVRTIESGDGTNSALQLSNGVVNVNGTFQISGVALTATVSKLNELTSIAGTLTSVGAASTYGTGTGIATDPSAGITNEGFIQLQTNQSFGIVSVSTNLAGVLGGFTTSLSATNFVAGTGSFTTKVSGVAAEFSGAVSAANVYATTQIYIGGSAIPSTSDVAAVSALTSVNKAAITSVNTVLAATSAALATSIGTTNTLIAATSSALATSIGTTNTLIATTSAALATSIGNHLPLAGGTLTGTVSGTDFYVSAVAIGINSLLGKNLRIEAAAVADVNALTDGTNISVDFNAGQNFTVTLAGNRTLDNPTNCVAGQVGSIFIVQDATGSQTLAYGTSWDFAGGEAPTLSTGGNAIDRLDYIVHTSTDVQALLTKAYS